MWYVKVLKGGPVFCFCFFLFFLHPGFSFSPSLSPFAYRFLAQLLRTRLTWHCLSLAHFLNLSCQRPEFISVLLVLLLRPIRLDWHLMTTALSQAMRSGSICSPVRPILGPLHAHTDYPVCAFLQGGCQDADTAGAHTRWWMDHHNTQPQLCRTSLGHTPWSGKSSGQPQSVKVAASSVGKLLEIVSIRYVDNYISIIFVEFWIKYYKKNNNLCPRAIKLM